MTTLKSILETEYRPEVISGHIHRRQRELDDILGDQTERQRSYAKLQMNDVLDLFFIRSFCAGITCNQHLATIEKYDIIVRHPKT
ncbi:hypothetical protein [Rhizobium leguminosarum]|uniref:hypothetical protein n=1 Tax=Rhizobium leguminosarum TaxID=384 RepID=UPI0012BD0B4E|nr:hypothetical protein [Rhizobium leguminosarum]WFT86847.1 hypothetical protein QA638_04305 [Rhizobium leguminosarum]